MREIKFNEDCSECSKEGAWCGDVDCYHEVILGFQTKLQVVKDSTNIKLVRCKRKLAIDSEELNLNSDEWLEGKISAYREILELLN